MAIATKHPRGSPSSRSSMLVSYEVHFVRVGLDSHYRGYRLRISNDNICRDTAMPMAIQSSDN